MSRGVTIGQAAAFVGVTIKTIRHYHRLGLIDEPRRDGSDYRRYGSDDLLRLVRVRTLAAAGVPLAEIGPLLDAGGEQFTTAVADVEQRLNERIKNLTAQREMLRRLADADGVLLTDRARAFLDRLPDLGVTANDVAFIREGLVLTRALIPEGFDDYLARVDRALDDTQFVELNKRCLQAAAWEPDDPRIEKLATAMADYFLANPASLDILTSLQARNGDDDARYELIKHHRKDQAPAWVRLTDLVEKRLRSAGVALVVPAKGVAK
jgi:DNA-binding transcriptional MerR regulator